MTIKKSIIIELGPSELPAVCPNKNMQNWSSHPKISLDISLGSAICPYCGTTYRLRAGEHIRDH